MPDEKVVGKANGVLPGKTAFFTRVVCKVGDTHGYNAKIYYIIVLGIFGVVGSIWEYRRYKKKLMKAKKKADIDYWGRVANCYVYYIIASAISLIVSVFFL